MNDARPTIAPDAAAIDRELDALDLYLQAANGILRDGHMPDLAGLDTRIAGLCRDILALPDPDRKTWTTRLYALVGQLDRCGAAVKNANPAKGEA